jgi:hypothetical protein
MKVHNPASSAKEKDYEQSDVEMLLRKGEWRNYDDMIKWLQEEGDGYRKFTPGEVGHMIDDLSRLRQKGAKFITDSGQLYQEMKRR